MNDYCDLDNDPIIRGDPTNPVPGCGLTIIFITLLSVLFIYSKKQATMSDQAKITLSGVITDIFPSEVYGNFEKRVVWVKETTGDYPQHYNIEFTQGKCIELDKFKVGDEVEININLRGRHYEKNGKEGVINSLQGWRIILKQPAAVVAARNAEPAAPAEKTFTYESTTDSGDLPF